jgi:hypothetical protein
MFVSIVAVTTRLRHLCPELGTRLCKCTPRQFSNSIAVDINSSLRCLQGVLGTGWAPNISAALPVLGSGSTPKGAPVLDVLGTGTVPKRVAVLDVLGSGCTPKKLVELDVLGTGNAPSTAAVHGLLRSEGALLACDASAPVAAAASAGIANAGTADCCTIDEEKPPNGADSAADVSCSTLIGSAGAG